jgi:hypothetical protein
MTEVCSSIASEFREAKKMMAVAVEGLFGSEYEEVSSAPHRCGSLPGQDMRTFVCFSSSGVL